MVDVKPLIVEKLSEIGIGCYYELFVDSTIPKPTITYNEYNNYDVIDETGDTLGYSNIDFMIKLWGDSISELSVYEKQVDSKMHALGFKRISKNPLVANGQICWMILYEAKASEYFD